MSVFEKRPDPRAVPVGGRRSLTLGLAARTLDLLAEIGLGDEVTTLSKPLRGRCFHDRSGATTFHPYDGERPEPAILSADGGARAIGRGDLALLLLERAEALDGVDTAFHHELVDVDLDRAALRLRREDGSDAVVEADFVVGADGAFSRARQTMAARPAFELAASDPAIGYKQLVVPQSAAEALDDDATHIWPRLGSVLFALPNRDGSFAAALFLPLQDGFGRLTSRGVRELFDRDFPDFAALVPDLESTLMANPLGRLVSVRCWPWSAGRTVLLGDACHAMIPFAGQGANAALADADVLARCLVNRAPDWTAAFAEYATERKESTDELEEFSRSVVPLVMNLEASLSRLAGT